MIDNAKKAIIKILCLYLGTTSVFLCVFFWHSYSMEERKLIYGQMSELREISIDIYDILNANRDNVDIALEQIATETKHKLMIFNKKGELIYDSIKLSLSSDELKEGFALRGNKIIVDTLAQEQWLRKNMDKKSEKKERIKKPRFCIFIEDDALDSQMLILKLKMIAYFVLSLSIMGVVAYFLVRLSLRPMQEKIESLNNFIKDSTHEINTPLSIMLMSIEAMPTNNLSPAQKQKLERIRLGAKSISHLYKDLVAYNFPHSISNKIESIALDVLLKERLEYFAPFFEQKSLSVKSDVKKAQILASSEKITCVIDNLLSNAIKYNKKGGEIAIELRQGVLSVSDKGCGMPKAQINAIFERYVRCNAYQGGFGIGLALIKRICDEYHIAIKVESTESIGSTFRLEWS